MLPDSTKECINLASYNYLGFAENNSDCTDQGRYLSNKYLRVDFGLFVSPLLANDLKNRLQ